MKVLLRAVLEAFLGLTDYHHEAFCSFTLEILTDVMAVEADSNEADGRTEGDRMVVAVWLRD